MGSNWEIIFWVALAALAFVGEVLTVSFFLIFFALGAAIGVVLALLGLGSAVQIVGFVAASLLSMAVLRPPLVHRLSFKNSDPYESRKITGKSAVVTQAIEPHSSGTVHLGGGEYWTARALYSDQKIEEGAKVKVLDTDGLTALVEAVEVEGEVEGGRP